MIKELREKRKRLADEAQAILDAAQKDKRELTADEEAKFDAIHADIEKLGATIGRLEKQEDLQRSLEASAGRRSDPAQPEAPEHRTERSGRDPEVARLAAMDEADRLEGIRCWLLAGSDERHRISTQQVETSRRAGIADLGQKMLNVRLSPRPLRSLHPEDVREWRTQFRAQATGSGAVGGFTVPDETMQALEVALLRFGGMRQVASIIRTESGADLPWPTVNDTSNEGMILGENTQVSQQDVAFAQLVLQAYKFSSKMILVSVELLQDNAVNLAAFLGQALGERLGRITNRKFTVGTGANEPMGIVTAATLGKTGASGQTTSVIYDDFVDLEHSVDPEYRGNSSWMFADTTLKAIKKLKDGENRPLWLPGLAVREPDTILGHPFVINTHVADMAASAKSIIYGDLSKYKIRDVSEITLLRLDERFADYHQVAFLAFSRHDGDLVDAGTHPVKYYINAAS